VNLQVLQKAAENSDILGLGINHFFSKIHLDLKQQLIEKLYNVQITDTSESIHKK
jgi:translation elongation factor EF-4